MQGADANIAKFRIVAELPNRRGAIEVPPREKDEKISDRHFPV